jgi:hypothetical protein
MVAGNGEDHRVTPHAWKKTTTRRTVSSLKWYAGCLGKKDGPSWLQVGSGGREKVQAGPGEEMGQKEEVGHRGVRLGLDFVLNFFSL